MESDLHAALPHELYTIRTQKNKQFLFFFFAFFLSPVGHFTTFHESDIELSSRVCRLSHL